MINAILEGVFNIVISLVNLLLTPIDALINATMPGVSSALDYVAAFFEYAASVIPWGVSWLGLDSAIIGIFVAYMTFKLTAPLAVHTIKLAFKWYNTLKL